MLTQLYQTFVGYALGGTVAVILFILMYRKSATVANSGNKAKMATFSIAPALLVIVSILAATAAFNFAVPRLQNAVNSAPVMGAVQAGGAAVQMVDQLLAAPVPNTGNVASFDVQPLTFAAAGNQQPIVPNSGGWLGGSLNSVAPNVMAAPTLEAPAQPAQVVLPTATPYVKPTAISPEIQQVTGGHDRYTVQRGDSMFKIAERLLGDGRRYGELCAANVQVVGSNCSQITAGMQLKVPTDIQAYQHPAQQQSNVQTVTNRQVVPAAAPVVNRPSPTATPRVPVAVAPVASGGNTYTIAAGDSIYSIAGKNGGMAKVYDICAANRAVLGDNCDNLQAGATLVIP